MSETKYLICWNCDFKNEYVGDGELTCKECGTEIQSPELAYSKKEEVQEFIEIRLADGKIDKIDIQAMQRDISQVFPVKNYVLNRHLIFVVEDPLEDKGDAYDKIVSIIGEYLPDMDVKLSYQYVRNFKELTITVLPIKTRLNQSKRFSLFLIFFTLISTLLAGIYNYSVMNFNIDYQSGFSIGDLHFNSSSIFFALQFSVTLIIILLIKDIKPITSYFTKKHSNFSSYFLPAPPIFELGTLGSFVSQVRPPTTKQEMFNSNIVGPIAAWLFSVLVFVITFPWATKSTVIAETYNEYSLLFNDNYEPLLVKLYLAIANITEPASVQYVLHPVTLAALAGIYIIGLNLLPVSHLGGGYLLKAATTDAWHMIITSAFILYFSFTYPLIGLTLLTIHMIKRQPEVLNETSKVTRTSKILLAIAMLVSLSSLPFRF